MARKKRDKDTGTAHVTPVASPWWMSPAFGNYLTIAAAVAVQFSIILLPLVGPSGAVAPHAFKNAVAWLSVLVLAIVLSGLALYSKIERRRCDGSPLPLWSVGLLAVSVILLLAWMTGSLRV